MNIKIKFQNKYNLKTSDVANVPFLVKEKSIGILTHVQDNCVHGVIWDKCLTTSWDERSGKLAGVVILW